jgi:hypothetical protein
MPEFNDVTVKLTGKDGNVFAIIGAVVAALRKKGHGEAVSAFTAEATSGDYDNALQTAMKWVNVR